MGEIKLLDLLKLNISIILQLIGLYLSFLSVFSFKKTTIAITDFLTVNGIEYVVLTFIVYGCIYILFFSFLHFAIINFADWAAKRRLRDCTYEETITKLDKGIKFLVSLTKMNEEAIGAQMTKAIHLVYNYAVYFILIALHISIILNKAWCWITFIIIFILSLLYYWIIFFFKQLHAIKLIEEKAIETT